MHERTPWNWTQDHEHIFQQIKSALTSETELTIPNSQHPFFITVGASLVGSRAVLLQLNEYNKKKVFSYNSLNLNPRKQNLSNRNSEFIGIVYALQLYEFVLKGSRIHIFSDHKPLLHCFTKNSILVHAFFVLKCN